MNRANITRPRGEALPVCRRGILEQLDLVSITVQHRDGNFRARNAGHLGRELPRLMWSMRKFEAEHITPESKRALKIRNGKAGVIDPCDLKTLAHGF
jgi:hypothetical protein